ncbi:helix-turn-helix transcriptional regulator [Georgenia sp. Z1491]|uniref:helix-turn-helix transcriptional regulator n=1 Tax=Georgenia sp. Z1491 TaxID=3416707 RepID=UPI003CE79B89
MSEPKVRVTKEERLLNLLAALRSTERGLSKSDVRRLVHGYGGQKDDAFERMFERDKDSLRSLGVPLLTTVSPVHLTDIAYRLGGDDESVAELEPTAEEAAVLAAAAGVWRDAATSAPAQRGLTKLRGLAPEVRSGGPGGRTGVGLAEPGPAFTALLDALETGRAVRFDYRAASTGELSTRLVDPWRLAARGRSWYLVGHDHDRGAVRVFHLSRVRGRVSDAEAPERVPAPADLDLSAVLSASRRQRAEASLALAPGRGAVVRARAGEGRDAADGDAADSGAADGHAADRDPAPATDLVPDGWDVLDLTTDDLEGLAGDVAALGDVALALAPPALVDAVRRRLARAAAVPVSSAPVAEETGTTAPTKPAPRREGAEDRLARLLSLVLRLHEKGDQSVTELAEHFGVSEKQVIADVELLWVTGLPGYQHDDLIDFSVDAFESGVISLANDQGLARPLRLTTDEAVLLLVALGPLRAVAGSVGMPTALIDGLADKLEVAAGTASTVARAIDVAVPGADPVALSRAREALRLERRLHLVYVSGGDVRTERDVDPRSLVLDADDWLLSAWCLRAGAPRTFRVDRIVTADITDTPVEEHPWPERTGQVGDIGEEVVVELTSAARPFAETVPSIATEDLADGGVRVRLRVADRAWFVGAMLDLGEEVTAIGPEEQAERVRAAARAALRRYGG